MVFIRIKKVKGKEYAYIVQNEWKKTAKSVGALQVNNRKTGSRQKVIGYLGRAYRFKLDNNISFLEYMKIENFDTYPGCKDNRSIFNDLIEWELLKFGVNRQEYAIDLNYTTIHKNKRGAVLLVNDGFMCGCTLKKLIEFKPVGDEQADGYQFAKAFVEAGINVPHEVFVALFGKLYKQLDKSSV